MAPKKLESTFINMTIVLTCVAVVSAFSLGFVYSKTKARIQYAKEQKKLSAIKDVILPGFDNRPDKKVILVSDEYGVKLNAYVAMKGQKVTSYAIKTYTKQAFSGEMWLMVGITADGKINKIKTLEQKETPGLGTKITEMKFKGQFFGKDPANFNIKVKKDGGDVDSITAATVTSRAYSDAVGRAYNAFLKIKTTQE
ncbi:MAG: RnfABCDGE type electron transport complex subunit G [Bacteriovoracaceae bacterium]|nr:RnfABCDGE type electron transport complex subunit G [Bacteriovoracaceae bacterium]